MGESDPLSEQIPEPELRRLYRDGTLRQRYSAARARLDSPDSEANRVVTAVAVLEGFCRAVAVNMRVKKGMDVASAYSALKHAGPIALLQDEIVPTLDAGKSALGDDREWEVLERAVAFRHLLVHEGTLLHHGTARQLARCAENVLERLATRVGARSPLVRPRPDQTSRFIGVDLAWQRANPSAVVVADGGTDIEVVDVSAPLPGIDAVLEYIDRFVAENVVVAIDAPLIIKNPTGQRPCEGAVTSRFGRFHAGAHASNTSLYPDAASVRVARELERRGFTMEVAPGEARLRPGRWFFEVYPHPAHVVLFGLQQIVKYKKGRVLQRRDGLSTYAGLLGRELGRATPRLAASKTLAALIGTVPDELRGQALKDHEDRLDALLCCYLAAHYWYWGAEGNEMIGDLSGGNIVIPTRRADQ